MVQWKDLSDEQKKGFERIVNGDHRFCALLGKLGTGKSVAMCAFIDRLQQEGKKCILCGTTGVASVANGGRTLHQVLQFRPGDENRTASKKPMKEFMEADYIFIDEASMMKRDVFKKLKVFMKEHQKVIFVGDLHQLPPTDRNKKCLDQQFFMKQLFYIVGEKMDVILLSKRFRQSEKDFLDGLDRIAESGYYREINDLFSKDYYVTSKDAKQIWERIIDLLLEAAEQEADIPFIANHNRTCGDVNGRCIDRLKKSGRSCKEYAVIHHRPDSVDDLDFRIRKWVRENVDSQKKTEPESITIYMGEKVMISENDRTADDGMIRYANGSTGVVVALGDDYVDVRLFRRDESGDPVVVRIGYQKTEECLYYPDADQKMRRFVYNRYKYLPLACAYAITTHKSQGMTLDEAFMDPRGAFMPGQIYTMLSRVKTKAGVHLIRPIGEQDVITNRFAADYYRFVEEHGRGYTREEMDRICRRFVLSNGRMPTEEEEAYLQDKEAAFGKYMECKDVYQALKENGLESYARMMRYDLQEVDDMESLIRRIMELDPLTTTRDPRLPDAILEGIRRGSEEVAEGWRSGKYREAVQKTRSFYALLEDVEKEIDLFLEEMVMER